MGSHQFPVSVKGVVIRGREVVLLKNERNEWELPGGKLDPTESPEACVTREIEEELQLHVTASLILDSWVYQIVPDACVLIVTYGCTEESIRRAVVSHEHKEYGWFPLEAVQGLVMPHGYKQSIAAWARLRASSQRVAWRDAAGEADTS